MEIIFCKPRNNLLARLIKGYYFITENKSSPPVSYLTFPNNYSILSVKQNSDSILKNNKIKIAPSSQNKITVSLVFRYNQPISVHYEKPINEITIYFNPLGLNHFVDNVEEFSAKKNVSGYNPHSDFQNEMNKIFEIKNRQKQIEKLEDYWISKFRIKDFSLVQQILSDVEADLRINDISRNLNLSRQYINRLFSMNIGKTPSEYRKIHCFRKSLAYQKNSKNLTDLSYQNLFFDQSHFIKDFKEITSLCPSAFFKNVDTDKENVWLFI